MLNKILKLERPLAFVDLETTGINPNKDRIIQIAITIHYLHRDPIAWSTLVDPEIPIKNFGQHNITDEDVKGMPVFGQIAPALAPKINNVDFAGHNVDFDLRFLKAEMTRANVYWNWQGYIIDTCQICRIKIPHTLNNAYKRFVDPKGIPLKEDGSQGAHDAANDVAATEKILYAQLLEFEDLPRTVKELAEVCINRNKDSIDKSGKFIWIGDEACINFGKHKGTPLRNVSKDYLVWMINTPNFPEDAILIAGDALKGKYPVK